MKFVTKVTQSGIARAMASALVLAIIISSTGLIMASFGPERRTVIVNVFDGAPSQNKVVSGATLKFVADDASNPDNGITVTTNSSGSFELSLMQGTYNLEVSHPDFYPQTLNLVVQANVMVDVSLIPLTTPTPPPGPTPGPTDNCFPTPPRGAPLLNIWPISQSGANCTDYPLLSARNVTKGGEYNNNVSIQAQEGDTVRFRLYVHNGTIDYPENIARNVMVKAIFPNQAKGTATIAAEASADNAAKITSAQKGGNIVVQMGSEEFLEFVPGSARIFGRGPVDLGPGSDSVISTGQALGDMRGCYEFLRMVTFEAKVKKEVVVVPPPAPVPPPPTPTPVPPPPTPVIALEKLVRNVSGNQASFVKSTSANPGDQVEFQLRVTATNTVNNIVVSDILPSRLIFVNNSIRIDGAAGGNALNNIVLGTLTSTTKTITFRANVADASQFAPQTTTLTNVANLTSSAGNKSDSANVVVTVTPPPQKAILNIDKTVRNVSVSANSIFVDLTQARKDEVVEFRVIVKNVGPITANAVVMQDVLPAELTFAGSLKIDNVDSSSSIGNIALGNLAPGQSKTITFRAKAASTITSQKTVTNTATAFANNADSVSDTAKVTLIPVISVNVNLVLSKKAFNQTQNKDATTVVAKRGDIIVYTLTVQNTGTQAATNFVFEDDISDILQLADVINFGGSSTVIGGKTLIWPAVTIPAGGKVEKTFTVRVKNPIPSGTDFVMTNFFGNEVKVKVERPFVSPPTGTASTLSFVLALASVGGYFFYRRSKMGYNPLN